MVHTHPGESTQPDHDYLNQSVDFSIEHFMTGWQSLWCQVTRNMSRILIEVSYLKALIMSLLTIWMVILAEFEEVL